MVREVFETPSGKRIVFRETYKGAEIMYDGQMYWIKSIEKELNNRKFPTKIAAKRFIDRFLMR
tara:strand:+ start:52 stop:240 length:189 start_codon:yes stop_codon:yes gene_type:complete